MLSLVRPLLEGPLDVVGDVHGEIDALQALLDRLGYAADGTHPAGRRLVFVGDLTDRGPDSPAVLDLVQRLMKTGGAQCVLGNHDLNILLDHRKQDNKWFYGQAAYDERGKLIPQVLADAATRPGIQRFFRSLPIALERPELRVIHACWDDAMIGLARHAGDVVDLYEQHRELIEASFPDLNLDPIDEGLEHQNRNPVKLLSSGPEERLEQPSAASGKLCHERRVQWWKEYRGTSCVFGHYSIPGGQPRGSSAAFCIDYGVGKRWTERRQGQLSGFSWKLAALKIPERILIFDEPGP